MGGNVCYIYAMDMLNVIIVDDEQAARATLRALCWESYGCRLVGEAENAQAAFEAIERHRPDLALIDVVMPGMSGLDMIAELRERYPGMLIVLLSMHREFDYVIEAMRLGAQDYLLKGVLGSSEFFGKLDQICARFRAEKNAPEIAFQTSIQMNEYLAGKTDAIPNLFLPAFAATLRIRWHEPPSALFQQFMEMRILKALDTLVYTAALSPGEYFLLAHAEPDRDTLEAQLNALEENESAEIYISLALLGWHDSHATLREKVYAAPAVLDGRFYAPDFHLFQDARFDAQMTAEQAHTLLDMLRAQEAKGEPLQPLQKPIQELCISYRISPDSLKNHLINWQSELDRRVSRPNPEVKRAILNAVSLEDAFHTLETYIRAMRLEAAMGGRIEIRRTQQYIQEHLDEDFSMETLARRVHFSTNHFSMLFKKHIGISLREYIVRARMERAAELLSSSNMKVYEVARSVGMPNVNYFKLAFVKHYHITPSAFREGSGCGVK